MGKTTAINKSQNKRLTGRPTKLTPECQAKIVDIISKGNYLITACQIAGIDKATYLRWIERGEQESNNGGGFYCDFCLAIKKAESEAEAERLSRITEAGVGGKLYKTITYTRKDGTEVVEEVLTQPQWLADMTTLERRHPERWGRKDRSTIQIEEHKTITITTVEVVKDYGQGMIVDSEAKELKEGEKDGERENT